MSSVLSEAHTVAHAVVLNRLHSRRADENHAPPPAAAATGFADTVPLWFRSEAFAEDVMDTGPAAAAAVAGTKPGSRLRVDAHVMAAGAAVLRLTLQALQLQRRG